ncbi:hypothetical protein DLJ53_09270 [Acuticoccus sediminis]|uniref:GtrA/DPMS transmembrane domain-containing protein n=1 Tax=Acuticoccus sediminis TaxID=2184697 RepID=A0A8B2NV53_9HYPH|nr:GtrA family protein [Acuticoccus sediminis]RAI01603.1 hypothetical protein DLJ53_09270 [Acuticoccus sediminis]
MVLRFLKFAVVGGAAFVVDAALFAGGVEIAGLAPVPARLLAFSVALSFSFALNRAVTFADRPRRGARQFALYAAASVLAGAANLSTFAAVLWVLPPAALAPYIAMPIGVAVGLAINFALYNLAVFAPAQRTGEA